MQKIVAALVLTAVTPALAVHAAGLNYHHGPVTPDGFDTSTPPAAAAISAAHLNAAA